MEKIHIYGGGTYSHIRNQLALAIPSFGETAKLLKFLFSNDKRFDNMEVELHLTKMADGLSTLITNDDVFEHVKKVRDDLSTRIIIFNADLCDYSGTVLQKIDGPSVHIPSGEYAEPLKTSDGNQNLLLIPEQKILKYIGSKKRKDTFLVAFKSTAGATEKEQIQAGFNLLNENFCNLILATDVVTKQNIIISLDNEIIPEPSDDRLSTLKQLINIVWEKYQIL